MLHEPAQIAAQCSGRLRRTPGVLHLSQYLRLAQNHRIEAAGDPEDVPDGFGVRQ